MIVLGDTGMDCVVNVGNFFGIIGIDLLCLVDSPRSAQFQDCPDQHHPPSPILKIL